MAFGFNFGNNNTTLTHEQAHILLGGNSTTRPKIITNPDGQVMVSQGVTTLDKVLSTVLSSLALIKGRDYVPTTAIPNNNPYGATQAIDPATLLLLQQQQQQYAGSTGANLEAFLRNNTGLLLVGGIALVLFMSGRK